MPVSEYSTGLDPDPTLKTTTPRNPIPESPEVKIEPPKPTRSVLRGNDAVLSARATKKAKEAERVSKQAERIRSLIDAELADLPPNMRDNAQVRQSLENKANAQVILNDLYAKIQSGDTVNERTLETAIKLNDMVQKAAHDVMVRWPKDDESSVTRKIPRSVIDWLDNIEAYSGKVEILEPRK